MEREGKKRGGTSKGRGKKGGGRKKSGVAPLLLGDRRPWL